MHKYMVSSKSEFQCHSLSLTSIVDNSSFDSLSFFQESHQFCWSDSRETDQIHIYMGICRIYLILSTDDQLSITKIYIGTPSWWI